MLWVCSFDAFIGHTLVLATKRYPERILWGIVCQLGAGHCSAVLVVIGTLLDRAEPEALVGDVTINRGCYLVILESKDCHSGGGSRVDGQTTSIMASLSGLVSLAIVENSVVDNFDCVFFVCSLMHDQSVDAVLPGFVVFQFKLSLVLDIACNVNTRAIHDNSLVPFTVVFNSSTAVCGHGSYKHWHEVAITVDKVTRYLVRAKT